MKSNGNSTVETTTTTPAQPININRVIMHMNPHLDEVLAYYLVSRHGNKMFPGVQTAAVLLSEADINAGDAVYDQNFVMPIGCGFGRFDEHIKDGGRRPGETAATLVAKYLGIRSNPELKNLIDEAFICDTEGGRTTQTMLAELTKAGNRTSSDPYSTLDWTIVMIDAIINGEFEKSVLNIVQSNVANNERSLLAIFKAFVDAGLYRENDAVYQTMCRYLHGSAKNKNGCITELSHMVKCLYRRGYEEKYVLEKTKFAFDIMYRDQLEFQLALEIVKKIKPITIYAELNGRTVLLKLLVCEGDSPMLYKAALKVGTDVILLRQSSGNYQIFTNSRCGGLSLDYVIRMIRWLELPIDRNGNKPPVKWSDLGGEGKTNSIDNWYYQKAGGEMAFNGSSTHKAVPTRIHKDALIEILQYGFKFRSTPTNHESVINWCNARGITIKDEPPIQPSVRSSVQSPVQPSQPTPTLALVALEEASFPV